MFHPSLCALTRIVALSRSSANSAPKAAALLSSKAYARATHPCSKYGSVLRYESTCKLPPTRWNRASNTINSVRIFEKSSCPHSFRLAVGVISRERSKGGLGLFLRLVHGVGSLGLLRPTVSGVYQIYKRRGSPSNVHTANRITPPCVEPNVYLIAPQP